MALTLTSRESTKDINAELRKLSPQVTSGIVRMRQATYVDGKVLGKYKLLTAAAISVAIRCEPCIRAYVEWAGKSGATKEELIEFLNVAMAMQGCPGEEWAIKALAAYNELVEGQNAISSSGCCIPEKE
ncbi:MAG: carboxymuconolactone decarboxylase family protein [Limisphaerales bacterium]